jgi:DNA-directed RNA polymerase specialized sigma24 family protein
MTFTADKPPWYEQAEQVDRFVTRFGQSAYRQLAYYAAFPLVLTPELVHYLRIEFLRDANVPWEAEVDLLLSDLCGQVGYELYTMDTQVRAYLLDQIKDDPVWQQRMANVAQVLLSYVNYLSRSDPKRRQKELDAQRLAAMTYLGDDGCRQAVEEITDRLQQLGDLAETGNSSDKDIRAEVAYLTRIAQEQALQLRGSAALVEFAQVVQRLLRNPESVSAEAVARSYRVGEVELSPGAFPLGRTGMQVPGLPSLRPLTFETGQFVPEGSTLPPLETQTVEVVTVDLEAVDFDTVEASPESAITAQPFNHDVQFLLKPKSPHARSLLAFIQRTIKQFELQGYVTEVDIFVEAYLRGVKYTQQHQEEMRQPKAWMRRTAYNIIRECKRDRQRYSTMAFGELMGQGAVMADTASPSSLDEDDINRALEAVQTALEGLSTGDRNLIQWQLIEGLTWQQVQVRLLEQGEGPIPLATLRERGQRALERLRGGYHVANGEPGSPELDDDLSDHPE